MAELAEIVEVPGEKPQEPPETIEAEPVVELAESKRGRGRPAGAKDVKPRKRKVTIVEEPIEKKAPVPKVAEVLAPEVRAPVPEVAAPVPEAPPNPPVEDSPRTLRHKTAELLIKLHRSKYDDRRATLANTYSRGMMRL